MITSLKNTNAILTGASQGLGVYIARALAKEGVNLALAARSKEKLEDVAQEMRGYGVKVVAIQSDVTRSADRLTLIAEAEKQLGAIDILINNAGVEYGKRFVKNDLTEIEAMLMTNVHAPMLLTHLLLPKMIERQRGHIINMASLAGKLGRPYASVYGATKAAMLTWTTALNIELSDAGVSASVVTPGYVSSVGMFARHGMRAPWYLGESKPETVAQGVLHALRSGDHEVIVNPRPFGFTQALFAIMPKFLMGVMDRIGFYDFERRLHEGE